MHLGLHPLTIVALLRGLVQGQLILPIQMIMGVQQAP